MGYFGEKIYSFETISSTNDFAKEIASKGEPEGTIVIADEQTKGRGKLDRKWFSPKGKNLLFSIILRPKIKTDRIQLLTLLAGVSVCESLEKFGIYSDLKWPNDLLIQCKKVCGILLESSFRGDIPEFVIIGIGLNVNTDVDDFPPELRNNVTSLKIITGKEFDKKEILSEICIRLEKNYFSEIESEFSYIVGKWKSKCHSIGKILTITSGNNKITGIFEDIHNDGSIKIKLENGEILKILSGDIYT
jgi:BirA family biotin operon repressor/biotin-[acetyl-CoA-carboxylase] ligase